MSEGQPGGILFPLDKQDLENWLPSIVIGDEMRVRKENGAYADTIKV
jgi:hypothetical protein